jgi:RND family efflux transporter MFP subunit
MRNEDRDYPTPADLELQESQRHDPKTSPIGRQLIGVAIVAAALVGLIIFTTSNGSKKPAEKGGGNALNPNQVLVSKAAADAVELRTARVTLEQGLHVIHTNGVVHFSPYSTINVSPRVTGRIRDVFVKVGDHVAAAQPLATMVSSDAANAVDTSRDADEQLKLTSTALATARKQFVLGTPEVTAAEAAQIQAHENVLYNKRMLELTREQNRIGGFTDKPLTDAQSAAKQADTQLSQDLKDLDLDQKQYDRTAKLFGYGVAAKADVENAEDVLGKAKDAVANDREQSRIAHVTVDREAKAFNTRLYANQAVRQAETNYEQAVIQERAAATSVRMVKASLLHDLKQAEHDFQAANADAKAAHTVLSTYDNPSAEGSIIIRAPASGVITARNINPGQIVDQTGETPWQMMTIVNSGVVYIDAQVYEKDMLGVKVGERVIATSDALPAHFSASGLISFVSPGLDATTHALSVRAEMDNNSGLLKDGMFVSTSIDLGSASPFAATPIIPLTAVVHDGDNDYVFIVSGKDKYDRRQVTLGDQRGESNVAITKGLAGNETIVTRGALYLGTGGTAAD